MNFLPICREDMLKRGWNEVDFALISGDAYVDHPSFGVAIISRVLEAEGFKVGIIAQPNVKNDSDFQIYGKPRLGFMVTSGNLDSMVANYTVAKNRRKKDNYSPGDRNDMRPDRALIVYCKKIRQLYGNINLIIGGLEASLRRFAHYDYWSNTVMQSILIDTTADVLIYGMGENQTKAIAKILNSTGNIKDTYSTKGICYAVPTNEYQYMSAVECASYEQVKENKKLYAISCRKQQDEQDYIRGKVIIQRHGNKIVVQNKPMPPLTTEELDKIYELHFTKSYHPIYENQGGVSAIKEVEFSIAHNRGCFGACNFCSLAFHQGRSITTRSEASVLKEAKELTKRKNFKGYIHDVGGPTANFRVCSCEQQKENGLCKGKKCLAPNVCKNLKADHREYVQLLRKIRKIEGVKKVFIRSGIRFDYVMADKDDTFFKELIENHTSGQLKVAPEHCCENVLDCMGKPHIEVYEAFAKKFYKYTKEIGKEQYLVPYLMSSHPGCRLKDAVEMAVFLKKHKIRPEQVQDFYPTPGTISTCMFYTGLDPYTLEEVYVAKSDEDKALQRALLQYFMPQNKHLVIKALKKAKRYDLIGTGKNCLVSDNTKKLLTAGGKHAKRKKKKKK